jgi:hypothetical protein
MIGPVAGGSANRCGSKPVLQAILQRLGIGPLRRGGAGVSGDCGKSPQLSPKSPERPDKSIALHAVMLARLTALHAANRSAGHRPRRGGFESGCDLLHDLRQCCKAATEGR